ncbi:hypothetical protein L2E82_21361 [Cichorium intybus]|uniref:Uncharacterized protein n=1 Tax=Cichorium intybus TaxID=13427 RepID=A0ACB9DVS7_CICIN|nr:hypothetical protein L2E82_21361 [Cichorium intybus]
MTVDPVSSGSLPEISLDADDRRGDGFTDRRRRKKVALGERGNRNVVVEGPPVVKATQQKQRRMINNRESGVTSRERKQTAVNLRTFKRFGSIFINNPTRLRGLSSSSAVLGSIDGQVQQPTSGMGKSINLYTAINQALQIALDSNPRYFCLLKLLLFRLQIKPKDGDTENTSQPFGKNQGSCKGWESDSIIQVNIFRSSDSSSALQGRYSVIGAQPTMEVVAKENMRSGPAEVQLNNELYVTGGFDGKSYSRFAKWDAKFYVKVNDDVHVNLGTFISKRKEEHEAHLSKRVKKAMKVSDDHDSGLEAPSEFTTLNGKSNSESEMMRNGEELEKTPKGKVRGELKLPRVLEALSATGLRALRYAREVEGIGQVVALDNDKASVEACRRNIKFNGSVASAKVETNLIDARVYMLTHPKEFDMVDLDPYGSPSVFLDFAVQLVADGGMLMCTATDMAILCGGNGEVCYSKYGSYPLRGKYCDEMALCILLACIERTNHPSCII